MKIKTNDEKIAFVLTGPESSGKTFLVNLLDDFFEFPVVPEFARMWLSEHGPKYTFQNLMDMERAQDALHESKLNAGASKYLLADTDLLNFIVWAEDKFSEVPNEWINRWRRLERRYYLLCAPDIPWEEDPLREDPDRREYIFERHLFYLQKFNKPYCILSGVGKQRFKKARVYIREIIFKSYF
jgi:nicotinamide riboside kinase